MTFEEFMKPYNNKEKEIINNGIERMKSGEEFGKILKTVFFEGYKLGCIEEEKRVHKKFKEKLKEIGVEYEYDK